MRILYQSRVDIYQVRGGDTSQMEETKKAIEKLYPDVQIDIRPELEVPDINDYDLVHLFNLDWVSETYVQAKWAKKHNKPIILSAIHHSESEVVRFENEARYDIRRIYNFLFASQAIRDMGKNIFRSIFNPKKAYPTAIQIRKGIRNQQREILEMADIVLVQTELEAHDIKKDFEFDAFSYKKVVNGVDVKTFHEPDPHPFNVLASKNLGVELTASPILLNVGRIEPRKNQLKLIEAFNELVASDLLPDYYLVFIGGMSARSFEYTYKFRKLVEGNDRIIYLGPQNKEIVASAMAHKGVYIHPSWFETTGLVTLEASLAGMSVVVSGDRVKEYLGEFAKYCDPSNIENIKNAILEAVTAPVSSPELQEEIIANYSWDNTANQTFSVYKDLLKQ